MRRGGVLPGELAASKSKMHGCTEAEKKVYVSLYMCVHLPKKFFVDGFSWAFLKRRMLDVRSSPRGKRSFSGCTEL